MKAFNAKINALDSVGRIRVWLTLVSLALGSLATTISWLFLRDSSDIVFSDKYGLPFISLTFLIATIWLYQQPQRVEWMQIYAFCISGTFMLIDHTTSALVVLKNIGTLGIGIPWFPIVVVIAHLSLPPRTALWLSLAYNTLALGISIVVAVQHEFNASQINALVQFHTANLILTGLIAVFGRIQQQFKSVQHQAHTDVLTGIQNRRSMQLQLEQTHVNNVVYALLILDVDHFKDINDHYGHAFGDIVLRELAFTLENHTRQGDHAARWGGEEFLVLSKNVNLEQAHLLAERLRRAIVEANPGGVRITVSIGVAIRLENEQLPDVMARADAALYRAKNAGRDQVRSTVIVAL
jgi:diguanylate cyclase (GGDEF)-like protein